MNTPESSKKTSLTLFYDGDCPLCRREVSWLRKKSGDSIHYVDIAASDFDPSQYMTTSYDRLMQEIHAQLADGTILSGMDVFREVYSLCGFSWIVSFTRVPLLRQCLDWAYQVFARNRLRLTGRCSENDVCEKNSYELSVKRDDQETP